MRKQARPAARPAAFAPKPSPALLTAGVQAGAATVDISWTAFEEMMRSADAKGGALIAVR